MPGDLNLSLRTLIVAVGVPSHKPESISLVRRPDIGSSQHCPSAVIPERGQITKDNSESPSKQSWAVFHEDETGSNFANDPRHVTPHSATGSGDAGAFPGDANVLTGKPASHHVNNSAPRISVKGSHVIPNRERREGSVVLSCHKHGLSVGFPFNGGNASVSEHLTPKDAATSACE